MRSGVTLAVLGMMAAACGGRAIASGPDQAGSPTDPDPVTQAGADGSAGSTPSSNSCGMSQALNDAGPGACVVGRVLIICTGDNGDCSCFVDRPEQCTSCTQLTAVGSRCDAPCAANEYAVSCGGLSTPDGSANQEVPGECRVVEKRLSGEQYACCPCL